MNPFSVGIITGATFYLAILLTSFTHPTENIQYDLILIIAVLIGGFGAIGEIAWDYLQK